MRDRLATLKAIALELKPCTVRQVFYQAVVRGHVEKSETAYEKVQRALLTLRRTGALPYSAITDGSRSYYEPDTFDGLQDALEHTAHLYRRNLWADVGRRVEFWLEKEALRGVVSPITWRHAVPLYVSRGFASESYLYEAAQEIRDAGRPAYVYQLGDHDPSGVKAAQAIERKLREFVGGRVPVHFERLAVTEAQIHFLNFPTRPTKQSTHATGWRGDSVELDAIHPDTLRYLVEGAILDHLPDDKRRAVEVAEESERELLRAMARKVAA
jgi:hypothetical protein